MRILGVDPGGKVSHAAVVERVDDHYAVLATTTLPGADTLDRDTLVTPISVLLALQPHVVAIEVARGEVFKGRSGDGVLVNNLTAGLLAGLFLAAGTSVVALPPSGHHIGFNWRDELGVRNHTDAGVMEAVTRLLGDGVADLPTGARGGTITHYWDAAGIALAILERAHRRDLHPSPAFAAGLMERNALEDAAMLRGRTKRSARASTRRTRKKAS